MNKILNEVENNSLVTTKICSKCREEKDLNEFRRSNSGTYGRVCYCKVCQNKINKALYIANREKRLKQVKEWNNKNYDKTLWYKEKSRKNKKSINIEPPQK